ncbi:uncharacterized protein LOC134436995 isoform X2 [Engraulis encrasicolus]
MEQLQEAPEEPTKSNDWSSRQKKAAECWKAARQFHVQSLFESHRVGHPLCTHCNETAVIRCRDCLPSEWFCGKCDVTFHKKAVLHNRESIHEGFFKPIPPSTVIVQGDAGFSAQEQQCIMPFKASQKCSCNLPNISVSPGKAVILISINGRYDLHLPLFQCHKCSQKWYPEFGDVVGSGYWPASICAQNKTYYTLDLFSSFEELKVIAPTLSRQAFAKLLEHRTRCAGRSGPVSGDRLQRSFLEFYYCQYEQEQQTGEASLSCPACHPDMVAVAVDGNRKLYRFKSRSACSADKPYFDGVFVAEDAAVADFVGTLHRAVKQTRGQGTCGGTSWAAAKEISRRANKMDEEGMEVAVCRHGFLLKALNMYRGEIFAYPMFLHKALMPCNATFFAMDVACKYWPYLQKAANHLPELLELLNSTPLLSVMHAQNHETKCQIAWSGKYIEGAGTTAGEEVEQVNSYLSRCALTTKYMSKGARVDMLTVHALGWNKKKTSGLQQALCSRYAKTCKMLTEAEKEEQQKKEDLACTDGAAWVAEVQEWATRVRTRPLKLQQDIEGRYLNLRQRKQALYRKNDSGQLRHRLRSEMTVVKNRLLKDIATFNSASPTTTIDIGTVERSLSGDGPAVFWPWDVQGSVRLEDKHAYFVASMRRKRLEEEKGILVKEMEQHTTSLKRLMSCLEAKMSSAESQNEGLSAFCRRRLHDLTIVHLSAVASYRAVLSPQGTNRPSCEEGQGDDGNEDDVHSSDFSYTSDEEETEFL